MRNMLTGLSVAAMLSAMASHAGAASACTAWNEFQGTQSDCMEMVKNRTTSAGLRSNQTGDTYYFWFGDNVVTARCIANHEIVVLAAYHKQNDEACPLLDRVKNALPK